MNRFSIFPLSLLLTLIACSPGSKTRPAMIQPVNNRAQLEDAIALLVDGNVAAARKTLSAMKKRDPLDQQTAALIASLDADPVAVLGTRNFNYRVQAGDDLTHLAERFLSDRLKFYLLARYNGIAVPKAIVTGQVLRIPGTAPAVIPPPRVVRPSPPEIKRPPVISIPKQPAAKTASVAAIRQSVQLRGAGLTALNLGRVDRAVALLRQAAALNPASSQIRNDLARAIRIQATVAARR